MLITIQICFYMNSYQDFISSLSTDKSYVDACYFLDKTDSVKKQIALRSTMMIVKTFIFL